MEQLHEQIQKFIFQKNYPCVAAVRSVRANEYIIGRYQNFGEGAHWRNVRQDLRSFMREQKRTGSTYLTYWAVFDGESDFSEDEFEKCFWNELSYLTSLEQRESDWGRENILNPNDPGFCLSIDGEAFFVVGLHPNSSRLARRFFKPALIFNLMSQFENLERNGEYNSMKKAIRKRDVAFQGSVNPMVLEHGDAWESIQFSGKENPSSWKCPFHFLMNKEKR